MYQNTIKLSILFLIGSVFLVSYSFSQNTESNQTGYQEVNEKLEINNEGKANLDRVQKILTYFCNDGFEKSNLNISLNTIARPGESKEICLILKNTNQERVSINLGLSSAIKNSSVICNLDEIGYNKLGETLVKNYKKSDFSFSLEPDEQTIKKYLIQIPKTQSGNLYGCTSIKIKNDIQNAEKGKIFNIEIAKNNYMEFNITGSVYNYQRLDDSKYLLQNNKQAILKTITGIILLRLLVSIIEQAKKKKHHKKKNK